MVCGSVVSQVTLVKQLTFGNLCPRMKSVVQIAPHGKKQVRDVCAEPCPIERGMRIIGGKSKGSILWHLQDGPVRFNDLARQLGGASKKIVAQRLKEMEEIGLVKRKVLSTRPADVAP